MFCFTCFVNGAHHYCSPFVSLFN